MKRTFLIGFFVGFAATMLALSAHAEDRIIGGRPHGCPYQFCGCEASLYVFGHIVPELNLAANWARKFPRANAAPGMAAVRNHHVMVLMKQFKGARWVVHDGNSGKHLTREHARSIKGYVIVNPNPVMAAQ